MLKEIISAALVIIPFTLLSGGTKDYNDSIQSFWKSSDEKVTRFIIGLSKSKVGESEKKVANALGLCSIVFFSMIISEGKMHQDTSIYIYLSFIFLSLWFSIKWFTIESLKKNIEELSFWSFSPLLLPSLDFVMDTNFSYPMVDAYNSFTQKLSIIGIEHQTKNPFVCAIALSAVMITSIFFYFTTTTLILIPFRLSTAIITLMSIKIASIMCIISPKRPIRPILILMGITGGTSPLWKYFA
ncbi:hypothetical protein L6172_11935 [Thalassospiraceae bacterium SW-3-3]|nr:hypothetical protein L6172_11935 [Thalassospiraceae bacterium SW-3-3]